MAEGFGTASGFGEQTVYTTPVSRTTWMPIISEGLRVDPDKVERPTIPESTSSRLARRHVVTGKKAGGSLSLLMTYSGLGLILKHLFGSVATSGSGPYTHTFALAMALPVGLTIEIVRGDSGTSEVFHGCKISKGTFKAKAGEWMIADLDIIARDSGGRVSAGTPSFTTSRDHIILASEGSELSWNGGTKKIIAMELMLDNKVQRRPFIGSLVTDEPKPNGNMGVELMVEVEWTDDDLQDELIADTSSDVVIAFTDGTRSLTFNLEDCYVKSVSDSITGPGTIKQKAVLCPAPGSTGGIEAVLINALSTAIAA